MEHAKHSMNDMGEMREMPAMPGEEGKKEKHYPRNCISTKKIPDAADYDVGDEMEMHTINKVVGKREKENKEIELELEMRQCGIMHKGEMKRRKELEVDKETYGRMKKAGMEKGTGM